MMLMVLVLVSQAMAQDEAECLLRSALEGEIRLVSRPGSGVEVSGEISGLPPGKHGFHVHEVR